MIEYRTMETKKNDQGGLWDMNTADANNVTRLDDLRGWSKLEKSKQQIVRHANQAALEAFHQEKESRLEVGKNLLEIREILKPRNMWIAYLKECFDMSQASGYRYIEEYVEARKQLPKPVLEIVARRAYRPAQIKRIVENFHHQKPMTDPIKIGRYLDKLERTPAPVVEPEIVYNPDTILRECVNFISNRFERLPRSMRTKIARVFIGMIMTKFGFGAVQSFEPEAIPETFRAVRGRPTKTRVA